MTNVIAKKIIAATLAFSTLTGTQTLTVTTAAGTAFAVSAISATPAEAAVICRDEPIYTTANTSGEDARYFWYQPMKKSGIFGKCKKAGSPKSIKMLVPRLAAGVKRKPNGVHRFNRGMDGCSKGGKRGVRLFHAACIAHDICYSSLGVPKFKCEDLFLSNMLKISKHGPIGTRVKALSYTTAVGVAGHGPYRDGQGWAARNYTSSSQ